MQIFHSHYIDGRWLTPERPETRIAIDPATELPYASVALGTVAEVELAVAAARRAFETFGHSTRESRIALLERIIKAYEARMGDMAAAIQQEIGAPVTLAQTAQAPMGLFQLQTALQTLRDYPFEEVRGNNLICREPIGVCALITPWNWPANQIACKLGPALAAGCTVILKPSELAPASARIWGEIMDAADCPAGVFNLVQGDGPTVGAALAAHPDVDMISITGSNRAGVAVAQLAADTIKRVTQELGGKSVNLILPGANLEAAVRSGVVGCFLNSGQSCAAATRMLVSEQDYANAVAIACAAASELSVGDPADASVFMGPVAGPAQFEKVQQLIQSGIDAGAQLACGGLGRPAHLARGYYVRPTVFADVDNRMRIAREEIFGPVLCLIPYRDLDEAVAIANDTPYGLAGAISGDPETARSVARRLRTGMLTVNDAALDLTVPFGGYKQSGNGREWGRAGLEDYLEVKSILGFTAA